MKVKRLSESDFMSMALEWQQCLNQSSANPVFMSWAWQFSWWDVWSQMLGLELLLIAVYDDEGALIGLGPFYRRAVLTPFGARVYRLYLIGSAWRLAPTVRTEYCSLILPIGKEAEVKAAIHEFLSELHWHELVCTDVAQVDKHHFEPAEFRYASAPMKVDRLQDTGVRISTHGTFDEWLRSLGKNTRLKAYNRRNYLSQRGELSFDPHDAERDGDFFDRLNRFHIDRWGKAVFDLDALRFHRLFLQRLPVCGGRGELTCLRFNGECVSVLYDVVVGKWRMNLQAGFLEDFDPKVSLGSLHLGYACQNAFSDPDIKFYDLLAGSGKTHFYKSHFKGQEVSFSSFQIVRNSVLKRLYRLQAVSPQPLSRLFNKRIGL